MSKLSLQGVVFDADGTLFDTERLAQSVWLSVAREWNAPAIEEHYLELIGRNHEGIVNLLRQVCPPEFPLDEFLLTCSKGCRAKLERDGIPVKSGAREILEYLRQKQIPVALATSSGSVTTKMKLERSGLDQYFQAVITGDMVSRGKPDPEIYLKACHSLGVDPKQAMAVEDSKNGIFSAHSAGMLPVLIPDILPPTQEVEQLAFQTFDSLAALQIYLLQVL